MDATELMKRIIEYGADEEGINDCFGGDAELYARCFLEFLEEPNIDLLEQAIKVRDYKQAFASAHALKGLTGNLGLTSYYDAIGVLTESLRSESYGNIEAQYAEVKRQLYRLRRLLALEQLEPEVLVASQLPATIQAAEKPQTAKPLKRKKPTDKLIPIAIGFLVLVAVFIGVMFYGLSLNYQKSNSFESAAHLTEVCHQLKLYTEAKMETDWEITYSIANSIKNSHMTNNMELMTFMRGERDAWHITEVVIYTENGDNICTDGMVRSNDTASKTAAGAQLYGELMEIIDSNITYTIPLKTNMYYNGTRIIAVSITRDVESFLDRMGFSSFDGQAYMYLTQSNGALISKLTHEAAPGVYNVMSLLRERTVDPIMGDDMDVEDMLKAEVPTVYLLNGARGEEYVASIPIATRQQELRLFYIVPAKAVNSAMVNFSNYVNRLGAAVFVVFALLALGVFLFIYHTRKRQFDEALLGREHMFDLLVKNTRAALGLFVLNQNEPAYISSNAVHIIGDEYLALDKTGSVFSIRNSSNTDTKTVRQLNRVMREWDGKSEFRSGFILNDQTTPPSYFEIILYPVGPDSDEYICIVQDVTQVYEREAAAKSALNMAARANEAKSRFLSNISHDIRTPMNAIVNLTDFAIESADQPEKLNTYLQTIRGSSGHLLNLINDVLDMSRIENGQLVIESEPFDIRREMQRQADIIRPLCAAKSLTFIADFDCIQTVAVLGDRRKIAQIVMNLLSNAVKFTPEKGTVTFTAAEIPALRDDVADMRFTIEDNGIGIPKEYIQNIFDPFSRGDEKRVSGIEGTGLGLSICHSYVQAMGGSIHCESAEGKGSVFTVELFLPKAGSLALQDGGLGTDKQRPFLAMRCLLGEDNEINQTIAKTILERLGFMVDIAADGRESVEKLLGSEPGYYDMIYMDIQMPVMDGYQAVAAIRCSSHPQAKTIPIIAITANTLAEDIERARSAGMDGHLSKPIMLLKLIEETNNAINKRKGSK